MRSLLARCLVLTVFLYHVKLAMAYNVDTSSPIIKEGPRGSYFGFSVVHKRYHAVDPDETDRIIVGAPKYSGPTVNNLAERGVVYSCSGILGDSCKELPYSQIDFPNYVENGTGTWFGAAVAGEQGVGGSIMACGHRAVLTNSLTGSLSIVGRCLRYRDTGDVDVFSPCTEDRFDNEDTFYGWCQAGSSVAFHHSSLLMGAPGSRTWSGAFKWEDDSPDGSFNAFVTEIPPRKYSYFGSSVVAATNLLGGGAVIAVSGAPKANDVGEVLLFEKYTGAVDSGKLDLTLSGDQFGSSFGHSITTVDVTGNESPSLVVSAPYYRGRNIGGAIYIYDNYGQGILHTPRKIVSRTMTDRDCADLRCEDAAFGYSLANIGDINGDGYNDLAVGAPYEGGGAVYIFLGGKDDASGKYRLSETFSQRIYAGELAVPPLGFGISVAGYAYPSNPEGYDALLVGAYKSDKVYLLRSRPVVNILPKITPTTSDIIDPSAVKCDSRPDIAMPCAVVRVCFTANSNRNVGNVAIAYKLIGDAGEARVARRRIQMSPYSDSSELYNQTVIPAGKLVCVDHYAFVRDVRDLLKPITMVVEYDVGTGRPSGNRSPLISYPVLNSTSSKSARCDLHFKKQCVNLNCDTNVAIALNFSDSFVTPDDNTSTNAFVFSSGDVETVSLAITVSVDNTPATSPAYETVVSVDLPQQLSFSAYESSVLQPVSCSTNLTRVTCVLPKIITRGSVVTFSVKLKVITLGSVPSTIVASVSIANNDTSKADNVRSISIRQVIKTDLAIVGQAEGAQVFYNDSIRGSKSILYLDEIGSYVMHRYTIVNNGPGDVAQVTLTAEWPHETINSGYLLYMEREPELRSEDDNSLLPCKFDENKINPEGYVARPSSSQPSGSTTATAVPSRSRRAASGSGGTAASGAVHDGNSHVPRQQVTLDCRQKTAKCFNITCDIAFFKKRTRYVLSLPARLWGSTLWSEGYKQDVEVVHIISRASLYIDPALNIEQPTHNDAAFVSTDAQPSIVPVSKEHVAWWIYAVAGGAGVVLLVAVILIFWKCGFFQRHRPMLHEGKVEKKRSETEYKYEPVPTSEKAQ